MTWKPPEMTPLEYEVAAAIMRAFFSRPVDEQIINIIVHDQLDIAKAAIEAMELAGWVGRMND